MQDLKCSLEEKESIVFREFSKTLWSQRGLGTSDPNDLYKSFLSQTFF